MAQETKTADPTTREGLNRFRRTISDITEAFRRSTNISPEEGDELHAANFLPQLRF